MGRGLVGRWSDGWVEGLCWVAALCWVYGCVWRFGGRLKDEEAAKKELRDKLNAETDKTATLEIRLKQLRDEKSSLASASDREATTHAAAGTQHVLHASTQHAMCRYHACRWRHTACCCSCCVLHVAMLLPNCDKQ